MSKFQEPTDESREDTSEHDPNSQSMMSSIIRSVIGLGLFAVITAGLIALTQSGTATKIEEQIRLARSKALFEIAPMDTHNNDLLNDAFTLQAAELGLDTAEQAFIAKQDGLPVALILPVIAPNGYTGPIKLIVAVNTAGVIQGVRVTSHQETPGLGDKIDIKKSSWITVFDGLSLASHPAESWQVKKDGGEFDQLTGATITPRAIVRAIHNALAYYQQHQSALLQQLPGAHFDMER